MKIYTPRSKATLQRSNHFTRFLFSFAILAASILSLTADAFAQSLTVGTASALPGDSVDVAISFTTGATDVSTLQFDLTFPGSLGYVSTATGSAASSASKSATGSAISGGVRVLIFGLNQNAIRPHPDTGSKVVAVVRLDVPSGTAPGILPLSINAISASDPFGGSVHVSGNSGSVTVNGPPDTTNPSVTITAPTSSSTYTASSTPIDVKGTASDNVGVTKVTWSNNRGGSGTASGTTSWSIANVALKDGSNEITVTAHDAAGNTHSDKLTVSYASPDTRNPSITITSPTDQSTYTASSTPIDVKGTASDNVGVTKVTWSNNRGGSGTASGTTSWSIANVALKDGSNEITVTAHDAADNTHSDKLTVSYASPDGSAPSITVTSPTSGSTYTTGSNSISLDGTASDDVGVTGVTWKNDRGGHGDASGTTDWNISGISLQSGTNVITVTARDAANNTGTDTLTVTYNPANTGPSITITSPTTEPSYNTPTAHISLSGTADANSETRIVDVVWANDRGGHGNASGAESWSIAKINLERGANVITVTAHDSESNTASDRITVHYETGDSTKPTITITAPTSDPTFDSAKESIVLSGDASDNAAVMKITWESDRGGSGTGTFADNANAYQGEVSLAGAHWTTGEIELKSGTNVITVMAYDSSENTQTDKLTVTFNAEDTTPPTISGIEVSNLGETSATVSWTTSEAADAQVEYGPNKKYGSSTLLDGTLATSHTATIQSLEPGKKYHFRVRSRDRAGNLAVSRNHKFKTDPGPDRQGPRISRVRAWNIRSKKVWIIWATSEKSDSKVDFGVTRTLGESTPVQERMTRYHRVVLRDLAENTRYFYSVTSSDTHGNASTSDIYTFKTDEKPVWRRRLWWPRLRTRFRRGGGEPGTPEALTLM